MDSRDPAMSDSGTPLSVIAALFADGDVMIPDYIYAACRSTANGLEEKCQINCVSLD